MLLQTVPQAGIQIYAIRNENTVSFLKQTYYYFALKHARIRFYQRNLVIVD